jgi:hypothetical protein
MKGLTLTTKEQTRLQIMDGVLERQWTVIEAAQLLGVSERHTWRLLVGAGLPSTRQRRPPCHRYRRARMPQEGMLVQVDGSPHRWLGDRGPWLTLRPGDAGVGGYADIRS